MAANQTQQDTGNSLELVDIKEVRGNTVLVKDGSLRQIVMVGGVNFSLKSDDEQTIITQAYQDFLNGIDFPLQIIVHSRKVNVDRYIKNLLNRKLSETSALLQNQIDEYAEFIRGFIQKNAIMEKVFLIVISYYPLSGVAGMGSITPPKSLLPFWGKAKSGKGTGQGKDEDHGEDMAFNEHLEQLNQRTSQIVNGLIRIGLEATTLENEQLIELFYNFYNPQTVERKDMAGIGPEGRQ